MSSSSSSSSLSSSSNQETTFRKLPTGSKRVVPVVVPAVVPAATPIWARCPGGAWNKISPIPIENVALACDSEEATLSLCPANKLPLTVVSSLSDPIVQLLSSAEVAPDLDAAEEDPAEEDPAAETIIAAAPAEVDPDTRPFTTVCGKVKVPKAKPAQKSLDELKAEVKAVRDAAKKCQTDMQGLMEQETAEAAGWCVREVIAGNRWLNDLAMRPKHWTGLMPQHLTLCTIPSAVFQSTGRPVIEAMTIGYVRGATADKIRNTMDGQADGFTVFLQLSDDQKVLRVIFRKIVDASTPTVEPPFRAPRTSDSGQARARAPAPTGPVRAYGGGAAERERAQGGK